jgi:hypothetical protein
MARIKYVINERRLAYEGAIQIIARGPERKVRTKRKRAARRKATLEGKEEVKVQETVAPRVEEPPVIVHRTAAERAAAGLFGQT